MNASQVLRGGILAGMIVLGIGASAWAADDQPLPGTPPADSALSLTRYYTASLANVGQFPGNLVRLSCDADGSANPGAQREQPRHDYALVLQGDDTIHPLLPGTDEVRRELSSANLQGADVLAQGKYYPSTGVIFVNQLVFRNPGTVHGTEASESERHQSSAIRLSLARCASD
jgi:hypothetical protein